MIVKNESRIIGRCLDSARALIDGWLVIDTGSSDDTRDIVRARLQGIPGELLDRPWVDFGHNRSELVGLAKGRADYLLLLDADMVVRLDPGFSKDRLTADSYLVRYEGELDYAQKLLVRGDLDWRFVGATHEGIVAAGERTSAELSGLRIRHLADGSTRPEKLARDLRLLRQAVERDPLDARAVFYLAQTLRDSADRAGALQWYRRRIELGGWPEEVWCAAFQVACMLDELGAPDHEVVGACLAAYERDPARAEPLYRLARRFRLAESPHLGFLFARNGLDVPYPDGRLFVERDVYEWRLLDECAINAWWTGRFRESVAACDRLLAEGKLPAVERARVETNRAFGLEKLSAHAVARR
jgi:glycosyltransferase involved in cell wall biosynthesis